MLQASIASLRAPLPSVEPLAPMSAELSALLGRAAESLRRGDAAGALELADEAQRLAPSRIEPLELQLLAQLSIGDRASVRATLGAVVNLAPANAIGLAFRGLDAAQAGRSDEALGYLAHFLGPDAIPARGASIPLPTAPGELEEVAACCALRLGHAEVAFVALDAAARQRIGDEPALRRLALLRADALATLGRMDEAVRVLERLEQADAPTAADATDPVDAGSASDTVGVREDARSRVRPDEVAMLAAFRHDVLATRTGRADERIRSVASEFRAQSSDPVLLDRLLALAYACSSAGCDEVARAELAGDGDDRVRLARALVVAARASRFGGSGAARSAHEALASEARALVGRPALDPSALRAVLRSAAQSDPRRAASLACDLVLAAPNELDPIARAYMGIPTDPDALLAALDADGRTSASDPLRSRVLARLGFAEDALLVAESARGRDSAASPVLAASALAAAELADVTILSEVDEVARSGAAALAPTLARAWTLVGDETRATERVAAIGADRSPNDAATMLARQLASRGRTLLATRLPIADECLALSDALDPFGGALEQIAQRTGTPTEAIGLAPWAFAVADSTPSIPARRKLRLFLELGQGSIERPAVIPATGWSARFDARVLAVEALRAEAAIAAARSRPQTVDAQAALARTLVAAGRIDEAASIVERCATNDSVEGNSRAVGALLAAASDVARREPARARAMSGVAEALLPRLGRATSADMLAAMRLAIATRADELALSRLATRLIERSRPLGAQDVGGCLELLDTLRRIDDDPLPAALLADAIARDARADPLARRRIARTAVALLASSGGGSERTRALVVELAADGISVFAREGDRSDAPSGDSAESPAIDIGRMLVRASDAHALLGDDAGCRKLLEAALRLPSPPAEAYNNLAFIAIDRGAIDPAVIDLAATALRRSPDNSSILDTVGVLRYRQGWLRDTSEGPGAITLFRQALRNRPEDPSLETLDHLGDALWQDGDQKGAIRCWQQVEQVARLRYPPQEIARNIEAFQRGEFGLPLLEPAQLIRRLYGRIVDRAERKLEEVARGEAPSVRPVELDAASR
ncbi:MAG: hypothetical protein LW806_01405 [Planctomycetaceae bacterium]|nr:hypothetical protein [Planctomycetaceae bacterium]